MPDEQKSRSTVDPTDTWKQWYDNAARVWANALGGGREAYADPFGLYRQWLNGIADSRDAATAASSTPDPQKLWTQWFEATSRAWRQVAEKSQDPLGLTTQWLEKMEETRATMLAKGGLPSDPLTFFRQWYDTTSETWSTIMGDTIGTEAFIEAASRYMESYTSFYRTFRRTAEENLRNLQMPTRSDVARVAGLVVALEDKIDRIDEAVEALESWQATPATVAAVAALEERVGRIEAKLDRLIAALERGQTAGRPGDAPAIAASTTNGTAPTASPRKTGARRATGAPRATRRSASQG